MSAIESALRELKIDYKISGEEAIACCPKHNDRHPSWSLNLKSGAHHCFSCGFSGNLASLVAFLLGLSYADAVIWCNERVGWARLSQWREDIESKSFSPAAIKVSEMDTAFFVDPPELALSSKGLTKDAAKKFEVLWRQEDESWIFPVRDPYTSELWGWQSKNARRFRHYPIGLRRSETLFGLGAFSYGSTAVLVESPIDCPYLFTAGINGGLSSFGVQISDRQFALVHEFADRIVLALDNDIPGVDQTIRLCERDDSLRIFNYVAHQEAKDVGEMEWADILYGMGSTVSSLRFLRAVKKDRATQKALDVYRNTGRLSKASNGEVFRPWLSFSGILYGSG